MENSHIYIRDQKLIDNYLFFKSLVPKSYNEIYLKPLDEIRNNNQLNFPDYFFYKSERKASPDQKSIILTVGKQLMLKHNNYSTNTITTKYQSNPNIHGSKRDVGTESIKNLSYQKKKTEGKIYIGSPGASDNSLEGIKNFKSKPVQEYEYKKNLYLPGIARRLKMKKPRYERDECKRFEINKLI